LLRHFLGMGIVLSLGVMVSEPVSAQSLTDSTIEISQQPISGRKKQLIQELIELTGGEQLFRQVSQVTAAQLEQDFQAIIESIPSETIGVSASQKQELLQSLSRDISRIANLYNQRLMEKINFNQIIENVYYPLYDKYYTEEDLQAMINFYKTPTGRKTISVMPQLLQESIQRVAQIIQPQAVQIFQEIFEQEMQRLNRQR